ncbi:hypothetical protein MH928_17230 [Flavobacterium sp. WW92]|uniref:hypothetical protein n=1 Tax=unclassified Flavobacterium TaxID=196869 RepID=UPI002224EC9A|nr:MULTISPECIES: hypothetical protein [unclassified Flavobacterium]WDO13051.1 hypothetical protein MH928_17230 [Flavobacterium sp. WW92]
MKKLSIGTKCAIYWIAALFMMYGFSLILVSCKAKQKPLVEKSETVINNSESSQVNTMLERSKAINDSLFLLIGQLKTAKPECDSVCNEALQRQLESFNSKKKSGGNEFGAYYDKYKKMLVLYAALEETISQRKDSVRTVIKEKTVYQEKPVLVPAVWSRWEKFFYCTGLVFWPLVILFLGYRFSKIFRP